MNSLAMERSLGGVDRWGSVLRRRLCCAAAAKVCRLAACGWAIGVVVGCGAVGPAGPARPQEAAARRVEVATAPVEREALAGIAGLGADRVAVGVVLPEGFDATQTHPILITQVPGGSQRSNLEALGEYATVARALGYVVLSAQGMPWPGAAEGDTLTHRYVSVRAALRWLAREAPGSEGWPIVLAGFSGGAKISQALAFSLMLEQRRVAGMYLGGCNEAHSGVLLGEYPALREPFSRIAFHLSVGEEDRIAPPDAAREVAEQLRASGATRVKLSVHRGGHRLDARALEEALRWLGAQVAASEGDGG